MISYRVTETGEGGDRSVFALAGALRSLGYTVFVGETAIQAGDAWPITIQRGVKGCRAFVVLCSPTYGDRRVSPWTFDELTMAKNNRKPLIPVWHSGPYPPPEVEIMLGGLQRVPRGDRDMRALPLSTVVAELAGALQRAGVPCGARLPPAPPQHQEHQPLEFSMPARTASPQPPWPDAGRGGSELTLRIRVNFGESEKLVEFPFLLRRDTPESVAHELIAELGFSHSDTQLFDNVVAAIRTGVARAAAADAAMHPAAQQANVLWDEWAVAGGASPAASAGAAVHAALNVDTRRRPAEVTTAEHAARLTVHAPVVEGQRRAGPWAKIFLSWADAPEAASQLALALSACGLQVHNAPHGFRSQRPAAERQALLRECHALVPFVTPGYDTSFDTRADLELALQLGLRVGPVWYSGPFPPSAFVATAMVNAPVPHGAGCGYEATGMAADAVAAQIAAALHAVLGEAAGR